MLRSGSQRALPFVATGIAAIIVGGFVAAVDAHAPTQPWVWASAYLVLAAGVAQCIFGIGQDMLAPELPKWHIVAGEWILLNLGNAGVIAGPLLAQLWWLVLGTILFILAIVLFFLNVSGARRKILAWAYRLFLLLLIASSIVGLILSLTTTPNP